MLACARSPLLIRLLGFAGLADASPGNQTDRIVTAMSSRRQHTTADSDSDDGDDDWMESSSDDAEQDQDHGVGAVVEPSNKPMRTGSVWNMHKALIGSPIAVASQPVPGDTGLANQKAAVPQPSQMASAGFTSPSFSIESTTTSCLFITTVDGCTLQVRVTAACCCCRCCRCR